MATPLITPEVFFARTGQAAFTGANLTSVAEICAEVSDAITEYLKPYSPTPITLTNFPIDAPTGNVLTLPVLPVRSITSLSLHWQANGDPSAFTAADLLTPFADYFMPVDPFTGYSHTGKVLRRGASSWGHEYRYATVRSVAPTVEPGRGYVLFSGECGTTSPRDFIVGAARSMVSLLYSRRKTGQPLVSESWNGYSYSSAAVFVQAAAIDSPDVRRMMQLAGKDICYIAGP